MKHKLNSDSCSGFLAKSWLQIRLLSSSCWSPQLGSCSHAFFVIRPHFH